MVNSLLYIIFNLQQPKNMEAGNTKPKKQAISWHAAPTKKKARLIRSNLSLYLLKKKTNIICK